MSEFLKTKIYKIVCKDTSISDFYIGSTFTSINVRFNEHKFSCNLDTDTRKLYVFIRNNGGIDNWKIIKLEDYPCNTDVEQRLRERLYYELLEPSLNTERPYLFPSEKKRENIEYQRNIHSDPIKYKIHLEKMREYYCNNSEKIKQRVKLYRENNLEKRLEYNREYQRAKRNDPTFLEKERIRKKKYREEKKLEKK